MRPSIVDMLQRALDAVRRDPSIPALLALQAQGTAEDDATRHRAMELVRQAAVHPALGKGDAFQEVILERAIRTAGSNERQEQLCSQQQNASQPGRRKEIMTENSNETKATTGRVKKYNVGDTYRTVSTMGLQVTDANRKATCTHQFSRKTDRAGVLDLPGDTEVRYVGARAVYEGQASTKRMIFKVAAGSRAILDGKDITLDTDIEVAGVVNHIDADDPYNVQARENEAKRAEKARLKAAAAAAKTQAA